MKKLLLLVLFVAVTSTASHADNIKIKGCLINNRYDDASQLNSEYLGWNSELGKAIFICDYGIYSMTWDGSDLSVPVKEPAVIKEEVKGNKERELWANNFNLMYGNSGAAHVGNRIVTVMSRDYQSTEDHEIFAVRKWDATTGALLNAADEYMSVDANIESAGMSYNPQDGKVYGFFHITNAKLLDEIVKDPDYYVDADDTDSGREGLDDGYALCSIDLSTMEISPITPGLYYGNFVAFAINSEGRAFTLTSGGTSGYIGGDGKMYNINNELAGAQLIEIDLKTGLMIRTKKEVTDPATGLPYTEFGYPLSATGYCSQVTRQAACFSKSNPDILYWVGYYNSGKGVNSNGSWTTLDNREWRTNGLYDTALYAIDVKTGVAERLAKVPNRVSFACIWIDGDDPSEDSNFDFGPAAINSIGMENADNAKIFYDLYGRKIDNPGRGIFIVRENGSAKKVIMH